MPWLTELQHLSVWVAEHLLAASWLSVRFWISAVGKAAATMASARTEMTVNCILTVVMEIEDLN